jgi:hypothetical protein
MKINVTITKNEVIDVDQKDIYKAMLDILERKHSFLVSDYIDNGMYYELDYIHPHNRDEEYKNPRPATEAEQQIYNTYHFILEMYRGL